jgi:DNA replication protein DnaC
MTSYAEVRMSCTERIAQLKALQLFGMADACQSLQDQAQRRPLPVEVWLDRLIEAEQADRQARSLRYQLKAARFPIHRDLAGFNWQETPLPPRPNRATGQRQLHAHRAQPDSGGRHRYR